MSRLNELIQQYCPDGVEYKPLGEVCDIKGRIGFRGYTRQDLVEEADGAITLSPSNITNQELSYENCSYISWAKYEESPEIKVAVGDVIFTKTASVGKTALVKYLPKEATINPQLVVLKNIQSNPAFLAYVLKSYRFQQEVVKLQGVGSVPNISQTALSGITIPVPPLPVQEEIARILDTFAELQAELQAKLQAELQKRLQQYNYYRDNLLSFEGRTDVEWKKLGELGHNLDRKRKPITAGKREAGNIPYYGASGIVDYVKDYIFDGDYLLVSEDGANLLTRTYPIAFSISGKNWVNNHAHIIEFVERATRKYVEYYLNSIDLSSWISAGAQPKLTQDNLNKIPIPVPPLSEQQRIVDILDRFDALTTDITAGLPAEIEARRKQYEYYRDKLLTFKQKA